VDARAKLGIRWNTGVWSLSIISFDWSSNTVIVKLNGDEPAQSSPVHVIDPPPANDPGTGEPVLPCYVPIAKTPQLPDSGLSFVIEQSGVGDDSHLMVYGSFSLPAREFMLPTDQPLTDQRGENIAAAVPLSLLVVGLNWRSPDRFDWVIPVHGEALRTDAPARGCFAIDAFAGRGAQSIEAGDYICYMVVGGQIFGPQSLKIAK
jgi:hypothetical protein